MTQETGSGNVNHAAPVPSSSHNRGGRLDAPGQGGNTHDQGAPVPSHGNKHRSPDLVSFFKGLSFRSRLLWNKTREEKNDARDMLRMRAIEAPLEAADISDNDSIFSIASGDLELLCDQHVYSSFSDVLSNSVKMRLAMLKRKRSHADSGDRDPNIPPYNRRRMDGNLLRAKDAGVAPIQIPDIYYYTEDAGAYLPLPFFHPEAIRHVATYPAAIPLTRSNPLPREPKGRTILDIKKLTELFGDELNPSFSYDKYMESVKNYLVFQSSRDASTDLLSGSGNGRWSKTWINHFGFFGGQKGAGLLYPHWKYFELELRQDILVEKVPFNKLKYDQYFLKAKSNADSEAATKFLISEMKSSRTSGTPMVNTSKQFLRQDKKPNRPVKRSPTSKDSSRHGRFCLGCAKDHTIFQHITNGLINSFPDGKQMYSHIADGKLLLPNGSEPCFTFNFSNFASRPCTSKCTRSHICSFCGGLHPALSWSCRRVPNHQV